MNARAQEGRKRTSHISALLVPSCHWDSGKVHFYYSRSYSPISGAVVNATGLLSQLGYMRAFIETVGSGNGGGREAHVSRRIEHFRRPALSFEFFG